MLRRVSPRLAMSSLDVAITIRPAEPRDLAALGRMGAALMRTHYAFDRQRFLAPGDGAEAGYGEFLGSQLDDADSAVMVAEVDGVAPVNSCGMRPSPG